MKYTIGIDYGTLSGRAVLVNAADGSEICSAVYEYPHAVMDTQLPCGKKLPPDWALQHPQDYLDVLSHTVPEILKKSGVDAGDVIGLGIDFTACTMLPVRCDGTPLCFEEKYRCEPHAYVKLWKHHAAQKYATRLNEIAEKTRQPWLKRYGGKISSEWLFPKIWQILDECPEIYDEAAYFIEAGDWVIWQLTGVQTRNSCTAGYKAMWHKKNGYPSEDFFAALDPRLTHVVRDKLGCPVSPLGTRAGGITPEASGLTGLRVGTSVAVANVDAHVCFPAVKIGEKGKMLAIMGTSTCHMLVGETEREVGGICGCVEDGILPGYFGYEAGQSCVGDHFAWFIDNCLPAAYQAEADKRGISVHDLLREKAEKLAVGESGLICLDWWNGNRSVLVDADLSGVMLGMTLQTRPEEIYRALIEATAFGTRKIIETFRKNGVDTDAFYAAGGIARKNPMMMQIYADVIRMPVYIADSAQGPALGSAIFGAVAAGAQNGGYDTVFDAAEKMSRLSDTVYLPDPARADAYDALYAEYETLHDYFGRGANDVLKRLRSLRRGCSER